MFLNVIFDFIALWLINLFVNKSKINAPGNNHDFILFDNFESGSVKSDFKEYEEEYYDYHSGDCE